MENTDPPTEATSAESPPPEPQPVPSNLVCATKFVASLTVDGKLEQIEIPCPHRVLIPVPPAGDGSSVMVNEVLVPFTGKCASCVVRDLAGLAPPQAMSKLLDIGTGMIYAKPADVAKAFSGYARDLLSVSRSVSKVADLVRKHGKAKTKARRTAPAKVRAKAVIKRAKRRGAIR